MIDFSIFWKHYPRRVGKCKANQCWKRMSQDEQLNAISALELWKQTYQWKCANGMFIPYASTFLHQRRWEDEPWPGAFDERPQPGEVIVGKAQLSADDREYYKKLGLLQ